MGHRNYFRERRSLVAVGGTYDDVTFGPVQAGRRYTVERLSIEDETNTLGGDFRLLVLGHGYDHPEMEANTVTNAVRYFMAGEPLRLLEGESLTGRFTGATTGDILRMYFSGYWEELSKRE